MQFRESDGLRIPLLLLLLSALLSSVVESRTAISSPRDSTAQLAHVESSDSLDGTPLPGEIAFVNLDGILSLVDPDGSNIIEAASDLQNAAWPEWSNSGTELAFSADVALDAEPGQTGRCLFVLSSLTGQRETLACGFDEIQWLRWSSSDSRILFQTIKPIDGSGELWTVNRDGSELRRTGDSIGLGFDWLTDEKAIAVLEDEDAAAGVAVFEFEVDDIASRVQVSSDRPFHRCQNYPLYDVTVSNIKQRIAYQHYECWRCACIACACPRMYVTLTTPPEQHRLLDTSVSSGRFRHGVTRWSPDGRWLALFRDTLNGSIRLSILDSFENDWQEWSFDDYATTALSWSADADRLVTEYRPDGGDSEIRVVQRADGQAKTIGLGRSPVWRPPPLAQAGELYLPLALKEYCPPIDAYADIILVIDTSSSMLGATTSGRTKLKAAEAAARSFITGDKLRLFPGGDAIAILTFNDDVRLIHPFSSDRDALLASLGSLEQTVEYHTRLALGLSTAHNLLLSARDPTRDPRLQAMVVLSDGLVNPETPESAIFQADLAKSNGIDIWVVAIGPDADEGSLRAIASGPGFFHHTLDVDTLEAIYTKLSKTVPCPPYLYWGKR